MYILSGTAIHGDGLPPVAQLTNKKNSSFKIIQKLSKMLIGYSRKQTFEFDNQRSKFIYSKLFSHNKTVYNYITWNGFRSLKLSNFSKEYKKLS